MVTVLSQILRTGLHEVLARVPPRTQSASRAGCEEFDLGRCDLDNRRLAPFKYWAPSRSTLSYWRYSPNCATRDKLSWRTALTEKMLRVLPGRVFTMAGQYPASGTSAHLDELDAPGIVT
jgi:hypothetical protein